MSDNSHDNEGNFYKGLVFGALIGAGLTLFLSTDAGRDTVRNFRKRIDEVLEGDKVVEDYEEVAPENLNGEVPKSSTPRRFFRKSK